MHKDDQMTPKERSKALSEGKDIDRLPIDLSLAVYGGDLIGVTNRDLRSSAKVFAQSQIKAYELFGHDSLSTDFNLRSIPIALGAQVSDPETSIPAILVPPLKEINEIDNIDLSLLDIKYDKGLRKTYDGINFIQDKVGDEVSVSISFTGPFTVASGLIGTEKLLKAVRKDEEGVFKLLDFCEKAIIQVATNFKDLGLSVCIPDPVASGIVLGKKKFDKFVLPTTKRIVEKLKEINGPGICYHICGDTTSILSSMADAGMPAVSLDNAVDLEVAKKEIGDRVIIVGNVEPVKVVHSGTEKDVEEAIKTCFKKAYDSKLGYQLGPGCDIPLGAPIENIYKFMEVGRKCGKWPIDPKNFE